MTLGNVLRKLREQKGLNQKEFAAKMQIPNQNISNYERGFRQPDYETLQKFADFFEVSTDYLLGRTDIPEVPKSTSKSPKSINGIDVDLDNLTDYQQAILKYALNQNEVSFEKKPEDILEMLARFEAFYLQEKKLEKKSVNEDKKAK